MKAFFTTLLLIGSISSYATSGSLTIPSSLQSKGSVNTPMNVNYVQGLINEAGEIAVQDCQKRDASRLNDISEEILGIVKENLGHSQAHVATVAVQKIQNKHLQTLVCQR